MPKAASLAGFLEEQGFERPTLIESEGGAFEIRMGDNLLFSKLRTGRFPEYFEVLDLIRIMGI
ncbi:SelT/SelW/SelH family protein [candidate division KSB1 bacterium]|nr:MAG: SelT/SelW/SelH family protein [candidate division KSB1 bacterium]